MKIIVYYIFSIVPTMKKQKSGFKQNLFIS